ncbi:caspase family protein [Terrarubrum flagellatum]|uniref:caspase family protein n=1 Tax=Terrirubrum flagellatum TaxID=2895980 RepID=UPI003144E59E
MNRYLRAILSFAAALCAVCVSSFFTISAFAETRLALVIANQGYQEAPLKTAANDGALVAETLRSVGFDVSEARDLDLTMMRRITRDFVEKVDAAGDDVVVFVYFTGHAIQFAGANQLVPVGARLENPTDAAAETFPLNGVISNLVTSKAKLRFIVIDAPQIHPFVEKAKLARGPALIDAVQGGLIAFSSSPDEAPPQSAEDYGFYAQALMEMLREPGLNADEIFNRVTLRVHERSKGAQTPWRSSMIPATYAFLERPPNAPATPAPNRQALTIAQLDVASAYALAIERDTLRGYQEFIAAFPNDPLTKKIRARLAQKREALAWRRATEQRTREAYWTYRKWYPRGPHFEDAGYELVALSAPLMEPPGFAGLAWDNLAPPVADELVYFEEVVPAPLAYVDIAPPPPPLLFLPAPIVYAPPPRPIPAPGIGMLPVIGLAAIPVAAAIIPRLVRQPPPRAQFPGVRPPIAAAPQPVLINPPAPAGPRGPAPGQIAPLQVQPGRPTAPLPGQIVPRAVAPVPSNAPPPTAAAPEPSTPAARIVRPPIGPQARPRPTPAPPSNMPFLRQSPQGLPPGVAARPAAPPNVTRPAIEARPPVRVTRPTGPVVRQPQPQPPVVVRRPPPAQIQRPAPPPQVQIQRPPMEPPVARQAPPVVRPQPPAQPRPAAPQRPRCVPGQNIPNCVK